MHAVVAKRLCSHLVKRLHVHQALNQPFLVHLHHMGRNAAQRERSLYALVYHALTDVFHSRQRSTARTCLNREAIFEITAADNHACSLLGQQNVAWVLRVANGSRGDFR